MSAQLGKGEEFFEMKRLHETFANSMSVTAQWRESFSKHLWFAIVIVFLAEMGRIPCCVQA